MIVLVWSVPMLYSKNMYNNVIKDVKVNGNPLTQCLR